MQDPNLDLTHLNGREKNEILLVYPGKYGATTLQMPLSLLYIASPLENAGYKVYILDMRLENVNHPKIENTIFVGISAMSGPQIKYGLEFAKKIRQEDPNCPIVWGGVHPSLMPEQTAANKYVDVVVRGEGDLTITELSKSIASGGSLDNVAGITYKEDELIKSTPNRGLIDLDSIPIELPYHLFDLDKYPAFQTGRFHVQTSRGCPCRCGFCYNTKFNNQKWRGKSAARVLNEIEFLTKKFPNIRIIDPIDDNFFVDKKRVEDICSGIINRKIKIKWRANCRFDYLSTYNKDFLTLLEKAGCVELDFGGESGSAKVQSLVNKDVTRKQITKSVNNLKVWAPTIEPYVSWLTGLPNEDEQDLIQTFSLMDEMVQKNPKTQHYGMFVYTPFPSPLFDSLQPKFELPKSLEAWGDIDMFQFDPPWHNRKYIEKLHVISAVTRYAFYPKARVGERQLINRLGYDFMNKIARLRWRLKFFGFPIEMKIADIIMRKLRGFL